MQLTNDHLTDEVILKLYGYTERKLNRLKGAAIHSRMTARDIAHDAITKTMSNEREWNPDKCPELFVHLAGCAKSIIFNNNNLMEAKKIKTQDNLDCYYEKRKDNQSIVPPESMHSHQANRGISFTPEEIQLALSDLEFLMDYLSENRNDLLDIAKAMLINEISKPKDLALHLDIGVHNVNTKKLALKRIVKKIQGGNK